MLVELTSCHSWPHIGELRHRRECGSQVHVRNIQEHEDDHWDADEAEADLNVWCGGTRKKGGVMAKRYCPVI